MDNRGSWGSSIGFIFAAVGSAIGFGTVWAFPYKMGKYGGFKFLVVYLLFAILVGISLLVCELAIGRRTSMGPVGAYRELSAKYRHTGVFAVLSAYFIMIIYATLGGYTLEYIFINLKAVFISSNQTGEEIFDGVIKNCNTGVLCTVLFAFINFFIVKGGVQKGIEKFNIIAIPLLFIILIVVIAVSLTVEGAGEGLKFMFLPGYSESAGYINEDISFLDTISASVSQLFFSLSIGMGATITYGSYLNQKENLLKNAVIITLADTLAAIMSGLAVLPSAVASGIMRGLSPNQIHLGGPKLLFVSVQNAFIQLGRFGAVLGSVFFTLILIAAVSSAVSLIEVIMSYFMDKAYYNGTRLNRTKCAFWVCIATLVFGIVVTLDGFGTNELWIPFKSITGERAFCESWLNVFSCLSEGILMPIGAFLMTLVVTREIKTGTICDEISKGAKIGNGFRLVFNISMKIFVPIVIGIVVISAI